MTAAPRRGVLRLELPGEDWGIANSEDGGTTEDALLLGVERVERPGDDMVH